MIDTIRQAVLKDERPRYELCELAKLDQGQMSRLMSGKSGLSLASATRLCEVLGLELRRK